MDTASSTVVERVRRDPQFQLLVHTRSRFVWRLSALMAAIYFGFILLIAFNPLVLAQPIGAGVITLGIPLGLGVIIAAFALTGIYVWRANSTFDALAEGIRARAQA